jgi:hypothetical protein
VDTLNDMMSFTKFYLRQIQKYLPTGAVDYLVYHLTRTPYNTFFSGVDAYGSGISVLCAVLSDELGHSIGEPRHLSAVENNSECVKELMDHPNNPCCIFGDINGFFTDQVTKQLDLWKRHGREITFDTLLPLIRSGRAVKLTAYCSVHKKPCTIKKGRMTISGFPCYDFAPLGPKTRLSGRTQPEQAAWASLAKAMAPAIHIAENSDKYPQHALAKMFDEYIILAEIVDPVTFGCCNRRKRMWAPMFLRER